MKRAFTLMEVNLAILIMAGGILSIVGLYSLGFRENRQSVEDVAAAAYADAVMSPLVMALSSTNLSWQSFKAIENLPERGWWGYVNDGNGLVEQNPESTAKGVFSDLMGQLNGLRSEDTTTKSWEWDSSNFGDLKAGLIIRHDADSAVVGIGFRATKVTGMLLSAPMYYAEVRFQGVVD
mgnify:CR=1 FL=1